jgi:hypothetical protein
MNLTFIQPAPFVAAWRRLKLTDEDLRALESLIESRPDAGVVMAGTGGLRKLRFAPPSWKRGKSGSARVCYICVAREAACYLLAIYTHAQKDNLTAADKAYYKKLVQQIRDSSGG